MRKGCETSSSPRPFLSFPFSFSAHHFPSSPREASSTARCQHGPPPLPLSSHPFAHSQKPNAARDGNGIEKMEARSYARGTVVEDRFGYPTFFLFFFQPTESLTKISFPIDSLLRGHREEIRVRARKGERETLALASPPIVCFFPESQTAALPACSCQNDD